MVPCISDLAVLLPEVTARSPTSAVNGESRPTQGRASRPPSPILLSVELTERKIRLDPLPLYHVSILDTMIGVVKDSDIYVISGLLAHDEAWSYRSLAERLRVPHAVVQRALKRAKGADLYVAERRGVHLPHFEEFALHALRFVAPARLGALVPGVLAAWAAEPMASAIRSSGDEPPPVWPYARGRIRGQAIEPLHAAAPDAAADWPELGELLALLDSLRAGDVRVRQVAGELLSSKLRDRSVAASP